jgi:predicted MFS family arabinose efflux permease
LRQSRREAKVSFPHGNPDMTKAPVSLAFGGLLALAAGMGIGRFVYTPILPPMVEALHLSKSQAGLIASINFVGYLAGALLAALRLPGERRTWLLGALIVNVVCLAAMGAATTMAAFLALRAAAGVASAFILIFSSALVLDRLAAAGRSGLSAIHFAGVGAGIAVSAPLIAALSDWRTMWFASAALALVASFAVAALVPPDRPAAAKPAARPPVRIHNPRFTLLAGAYGLFGFGYIITATFIVVMVRSSREIAGLEPYIWVMFGLAAVPSVALWTWLGARWGILTAFAVASLVEAFGVAASAVWVSPATVILSSVFVGGTFVGLTALGLVGARRISEGGGGDPRSRIALMTASFGTGQIIGPVFAGYLYDLTGSLAVPYWCAAAALVMAAGLCRIITR